MTPTTPATIYDFNDKLVSLPLISLMTLVSGLKISVKLNEDFNGCVKSARKLLSTPKGYNTKHILEHLEECLKNTKEHYGL